MNADQPRWTVTVHRDEYKAVVVLRDKGMYISTAYSKAMRITPTWLNPTPWLKVQKTVDKFQRRADRLNRIEAVVAHDFEGMVRDD